MKIKLLLDEDVHTALMVGQTLPLRPHLRRRTAGHSAY